MNDIITKHLFSRLIPVSPYMLALSKMDGNLKKKNPVMVDDVTRPTLVIITVDITMTYAW